MKALSSLLGLLILILSPALGAAAERVVILHGIARTSAHMAPLADHLAAEGYDVLNLDYPSTEHPLEKLIETTREDVKERLAGTEETVHFVGYSMGGLVVRGMLNGWRPEALGRVVLLAVPNSGSEVATFLRGNVLFDAYFGPAGKQLAADDPETQALLGVPDYEFGVVAGDLSVDPVSSAVIPGDDDGKVAVERTKLPGMKDFALVRASHLFFPGTKDVQRQTAHFLKYGRFDRAN